jgi:hypothetical protein
MKIKSDSKYKEGNIIELYQRRGKDKERSGGLHCCHKGVMLIM